MSWHQATVGDACVATLQVDPARSGKQSFRYVDISGVDRDVKTISRADEIPSNEAPSRARKVICSTKPLGLRGGDVGTSNAFDVAAATVESADFVPVNIKPQHGATHRRKAQCQR